MDLRDWLIVIGAAIIVGIVVDGYRRMRLAKKDSLQMSRDMGGSIENTPLDEPANPELMSSARVIAKGSDSIDEELLNQDENIESESPKEGYEPLVAELDTQVEMPGENHAITTARVVKRQQSKGPDLDPKNISSQDDQEVLVINVHSKQEQLFSGLEIKELLSACGMEHGEMSIFHRHEEDDLLSPVQFSVANSVEPGYFDPDTLEKVVTPGVSFFMSLPGPKDYMKAFDYMLETAQCFAKNLGGELKDEHRSVMTSQTIEHCRQRIKEFERKQLSKNKI